jgi:hypothetical protein
MDEPLDHLFQIRLTESDVAYLRRLAWTKGHSSRSAELRRLLREKMATERQTAVPQVGRM